MERAAGAVQLTPSPDLDHIRAVMETDPHEAIPRAKHLLNHARLDNLAQARLYNYMCYASACILKRSEAEAVFHGYEAVRLARTVRGVDGQRLLFDSLMNFGRASERIGEYGRAREAYQEALTMPLDWLGRGDQEAPLLTAMGIVHYYEGEHDDALVLYDQAGALLAERGDTSAEAALYGHRGMCHLKAGDLELAEYCLVQAVDLVTGDGFHELRAQSLVFWDMAILQMVLDEPSVAEEYARKALEVASEIQEPYGLVAGKLVLAYCARSQRRVKQMVELSGEASRIVFEYGYVPLIQEFTWLMGYLYPDAGE